MSVLRTVMFLFACTLFSGCATQIYGKQSSSGGVTTTTTSTAVRGSASFSQGRASVSWGQPVSPAAQGGQATLSQGATGVLILGILIADLVRQAMAGQFGAPVTTGPPRTGPVSRTCSCYGYQTGPVEPAPDAPNDFSSSTLTSSQ